MILNYKKLPGDVDFAAAPAPSVSALRRFSSLTLQDDELHSTPGLTKKIDKKKKTVNVWIRNVWNRNNAEIRTDTSSDFGRFFMSEIGTRKYTELA